MPSMSHKNLVAELLREYEANKIERDNEYFESLEAESRPLAGELWENATKGKSNLDILPFVNQIENLRNCIEEDSWSCGNIEEILEAIIIVQMKGSLELRDVLDVLVMARLSLGREIHSDFKSFKLSWTSKNFRAKFENSMRVLEFIGNLENFGISLLELEKFFESFHKSFDESKALDFFKTLNDLNFSYEERVIVFESLAMANLDWDKAKGKVFLIKTINQLEAIDSSAKGIEIMTDKIKELLNVGWKAEELYSVVSRVMQEAEASKSILEELYKCFDIVFDYRLTGIDMIDVLNQHYSSGFIKRFIRSKQKFTDLEKNVHLKALEVFCKSQVKNLEHLVTEISKLNNNQKLKLKEDFHEATKAVVSFHSETSINKKQAAKLDEAEIKTWTKQIMNPTAEKPSKLTKIAVVIRAFELFFGYKAREVQVLSLILLYKSSTGTLAQINTGEGKTGIVAMLAVLHALDGKKVDIGELQLQNG
jgi:transcriptional regulator of NAD metabolism